MREQQTHCKRGHAFTPANTIITDGGWRNCRTCKNQRAREKYARTRPTMDERLLEFEQRL